jgi:hypothetical protein
VRPWDIQLAVSFSAFSMRLAVTSAALPADQAGEVIPEAEASAMTKAEMRRK